MSAGHRAAHMVAMEASPEIKVAARQLLGHCNLPGGYRPGSFRAALFDLKAMADTKNCAALTELAAE